MPLNDKICVIAANNTTTSNNEVLDYIQLASIAADRVKYYLDIPTVLITTDTSINVKDTNFVDIILVDSCTPSNRTMFAGNDSISYAWHNDFRVNAFDLTKGLADKIIMIDADYMLASDQLLSWISCDNPFLLADQAYDISCSGIYSKRHLPSNDIVMRWETVMCWDQSKEAEIIFNTAKMVRDNYRFYSTMCGFPKSIFRNDLAFSIASHLHNVPLNPIFKLFYLPPIGYIYNTKNSNHWIVDINNKIFCCNTDVHVLNKKYSMDPALMNVLRLQNVKA